MLNKNNKVMSQKVIAKNKQDWWRLVRADLSKWNSENHQDDNMSIGDWIGEVGPNIYGWVAFRDRYGDWDVSLTGFEEDEYEPENEDFLNY